MVLPLDDNISYDVFYDWLLYKNVNNVYAVVENLTTSDFKKVSNLSSKIKMNSLNSNSYNICIAKECHARDSQTIQNNSVFDKISREQRRIW